jgi:hypothetical protein
MNEFNLCDGGSGNMAMEYPESDNNGSASDASAIPKDAWRSSEGRVPIRTMGTELAMLLTAKALGL